MAASLYEGSSAARELLDHAAKALASEFDLLELLLRADATTLAQTENTQPAILATSLAAHAALSERLPVLRPLLMCGHSLGEWSALSAAGALSAVDAIRAVRARGQFMQEAVPEGEGAMAAIMGLSAEQVVEACSKVSTPESGVFPANFNGASQIVVAGHYAAVERAILLMRELGARRVMPLPVSAPFHCPLMAPVQPRLRAVLEGLNFEAPSTPIVTNVLAREEADPEELKRLLIEQVVSPVRFVESVEALSAAGVNCFVELGPGRVLGGLVKRQLKEATLLSVQDMSSLEGCVESLSKLAELSSAELGSRSSRETMQEQ